MRTSGVRLTLRKMKRYLPHLLGIGLLFMVGVAFFVTLFSISQRYEETAEAYFQDNAYADITLYGSFSEKQVEALIDEGGIRFAQGRYVRDFHADGRTLRAVSLTEGINGLHLYEGRMPSTSGECALLRRNARSMGIGLGDILSIGGKELKVTGFVASAEYIYLYQNERNPMAESARFGVVFVQEPFFEGPYDEILALTQPGADLALIRATVSADRYVCREDQPNYILYLADLEQLQSFAYIFPSVFAVLIAMTVYVMLRRTVARDRRQIGSMMALGASRRRIASLYAGQFVLTALPATLVGCVLAVPISELMIGVLSSMFEVPMLRFHLYPALWGGAVLVALLLTLLACLLSLRGTLRLMPANAMRPAAPKTGKRMLVERIGFLWRKLSFNTRYALKSALRNKGRFAAATLGICGATALLVFSLGFNDSIQNTQAQYFGSFANYDAIVQVDPTLLSMDHPATNGMDQAEKVLTLPISIFGETHTLTVVQPGFDMVTIPQEALAQGVVIPEYFAQQWRLGIGDTMEIEGKTATISAVVPQYLGLSVYTSYAYLQTVYPSLPPVYNTLYARQENMEALTTWLGENNLSFTTLTDDKSSFAAIMQSMTVIIWLLLFCSLLLGFTVLYSVGLINLSAREHEYMFMGVMGYGRGAIMRAHCKETLLHLCIAIPAGALVGRFLLEAIKGEFSGENFVVASTVYPGSYVLAAVLAVLVTAAMALVTAKHVEKLDIVEGLKAQCE